MKQKGEKRFMKKRKAVLFAVACCVIAVGVVAVLLLGRYHSRGYGISVGRLYFADFGTYLIDNNDSAMLVSDKSGQGNLFARCNSGDRVVVFHGGIAESYPAQTVRSRLNSMRRCASQTERR